MENSSRNSSAAESHGPVAGNVRLLVIGYGNTLRSDDGTGPAVAESVRARDWPGVDSLACPQLTPELAEPLARARAAVFVDASLERSPGVVLQPLAPRESSRIFAHALDPATLLALSRDLYGRAPRAWSLTVPAASVEFGETLSPAARWGAARALRKLSQLNSLLE